MKKDEIDEMIGKYAEDFKGLVGGGSGERDRQPDVIIVEPDVVKKL